MRIKLQKIEILKDGEGGGFRMGNTCIPVADSFWYMANQYNIVKLKKKIKTQKRKLKQKQKKTVALHGFILLFKLYISFTDANKWIYSFLYLCKWCLLSTYYYMPLDQFNEV